MIACQFCGTQNRADATYCNSCGGLLPGAKPAAPRPQSAPPHLSPTAPTSHKTGSLPAQSRLAGRYVILKNVGQGGMAAVYRATDARTGRIVAVKEMGQDGLSTDDARDALASFRFEADTLLRLRHPNLPEVYDRFSEGARHYLVMEFIDGQTLEQRLAAAGGSALPEVEVLGWARQVCSVLSYLHNQRPPIIFRDLKPSNVMLARGGRIKLIDFGIARLFAPGRSRDTQVLGTPGFAPPEQYGKAQTDARADVYALACTLYQLLSGYDPATTPFALPPLHSRNPRVSPHVQLAIERATKLDREARYPTIAAFEQDLLRPAGMYFRTGELARTRDELIALCLRQPQEAAEHLYAGRIEGWLRTWGDTAAAASAATAIRNNTDQVAGLRAFLGSVGRARPAASPATGSGTTGSGNYGPAYGAPGARPAGTAPSAQTGTQAAARAATAAPAVVTVTPKSLHFGRLVSGQRGTLHFLVSAPGWTPAQGQISAMAPWLSVDRATFNGTSAMVQVTAETSKLAGTGIQQANLQITSGPQRLYLPVTVEVLPARAATAAPRMPTATAATATAAPASASAQPAAARPIPAKYLLAGVTPPRLVRFITAMALAAACALLPLVTLHGAYAPANAALRHAYAPWWPHIPFGWPVVAVTLLLAALCAIPGALAVPQAQGNRGALGRWGRARATLLGALAGLVAALLVNAVQIFSSGARGGGALIVPLVAGFGAALGADYWFGRAILQIATFVSRRIRLFISLGCVVGGAWGGAALAGAMGGPLVPLGLIGGAILGGILASYLNRLLTFVARVSP